MPAHLQIALATCRELPELDPDERLLLPPLAALGIDATIAVWDDPDVDWDQFDLVVIRSTWDYAARRDDFVAWASSVASIANPAEVIAWNTDKHYLSELAAAGIPVVDTWWVEPGDQVRLPPDGEVVLKPAIGAGSLDTGRYDLARADHRALATSHAQALLQRHRSVMVQPYVKSVDTAGERSLLFAAGRFSHSITKAAMLAGPAEPTGELYQPERIAAYSPGPPEQQLARRTLETVPGGADRLLYARVDLVRDDAGADLVLEIELTEPSLFLGHAPGSAERFAAAFVAAAERCVRS